MLFLSTFFHHHSTLISIPCLHVGNEFNKHLKRLNNCPLIPYFPSTILISISWFGNIYINRPESDWFKTLKTYPYFLLTSYHYFTVLSLVYESRVFLWHFLWSKYFWSRVWSRSWQSKYLSSTLARQYWWLRTAGVRKTSRRLFASFYVTSRVHEIFFNFYICHVKASHANTFIT